MLTQYLIYLFIYINLNKYLNNLLFIKNNDINI